MARRLGHAASEVEAIQRRIASVGLDVSWSGEAANAFRSSLHDLPGELEKLYTSFETASQALGSFGGELGELQDRATWYARQIQQSESDLEGAQRRHDSARSEFDAASRSHSSASDPVSKASAQRAMDSAGRSAANAGAEVDEISGQIDSMRADAHANFERYEAAASRCCAGLEAASQLGIRNSFGSWFDRHVVHGVPGKIVGAVGSAVAWTVKEGEDIAEDVGRWGEDFGTDFHRLMEHPLSWENARDLLEDVKEPLEIAGAVVAIGALLVATDGLAAPLIGEVGLASMGEGVAAAGLLTSRVGAVDDLLITTGDGAASIFGDDEERRRARARLGEDAGNLGADVVGLHFAGAGKAAAAQDLNLARKATAEDVKYLQTENSAFKGWATRYRNQMSTLGHQVTDKVKETVLETGAKEGGKALGRLRSQLFPEPSVQCEVRVPSSGGGW